MLTIPFSAVSEYLDAHGESSKLQILVDLREIQAGSPVHLRDLQVFMTTESLFQLFGTQPKISGLWSIYFQDMIEYVARTIYELEEDEFCTVWLTNMTRQQPQNSPGIGEYLRQAVLATRGEIIPSQLSHIYTLLVNEMVGYYRTHPGGRVKNPYQEMEMGSMQAIARICKLERKELLKRKILKIISFGLYR